MSHYNVNAGVPKTLIQHLIRWVISAGEFGEKVGEVLQSVLDTEITPELIPTGEEELQSSEAKVGPFALQDFSLFQVLRYGFRPSKIAFLAWHAWNDAERGNWPPGFPKSERPSYSLAEIRHWLQIFVQRFYSFSQFKRSALPNGPKVSHGARCRRVGIGGPRRICQRESGSIRSTVRCPRASGSTPHPGRTGRRWRCSRGRRHCASATGRVLRRGGHAPRAWQRAG